jgi:hypothetical protein
MIKSSNKNWRIENMKHENIEIDLDDFRNLIGDIKTVVNEYQPENDERIFRVGMIHDSLMQIVKNSGLKITPNDYEYPLFELDPFTDLNLITIDDVKNDTSTNFDELTITLSDNWIWNN